MSVDNQLAQSDLAQYSYVSLYANTQSVVLNMLRHCDGILLRLREEPSSGTTMYNLRMQKIILVLVESLHKIRIHLGDDITTKSKVHVTCVMVTRLLAILLQLHSNLDWIQSAMHAERIRANIATTGDPEGPLFRDILGDFNICMREDMDFLMDCFRDEEYTPFGLTIPDQLADDLQEEYGGEMDTDDVQDEQELPVVEKNIGQVLDFDM